MYFGSLKKTLKSNLPVISASNYPFKVNNRNTTKGVKYLPS